MSNDAPPLTLIQQADFLAYLLRRCRNHDGSAPRQQLTLIEDRDIAELMRLEARLRRMAPHEHEIKKMVLRNDPTSPRPRGR